MEELVNSMEGRQDPPLVSPRHMTPVLPIWSPKSWTGFPKSSVLHRSNRMLSLRLPLLLPAGETTLSVLEPVLASENTEPQVTSRALPPPWPPRTTFCVEARPS